MEVAHGALGFVARAGVDGAGESELGVVGDVERIFEVACLDHRENGPKDLFLRDAGLRGNVGNYGGLDVVAAIRITDHISAIDQVALALADVDVLEDRLHGAFAYDRSHSLVLSGLADFDLGDAVFEALEEHVIDALVDDGAGAGGALLSAEAEGRDSNTFNRSVEVGIVADDNRILAAHFEDGALDPHLSG